LSTGVGSFETADFVGAEAMSALVSVAARS
jgi:hypothetical protein